MPVRRVREHHQDEQAADHELDLRLDHPIAVAPEEPGRDPRQHEHEHERNAEKDRKPEIRLDEDRRERERRTEIGDEGCAHQKLADAGIGQAALDEDGVYDRERRRGESCARDQRGPCRPVEDEKRGGRGNDERAGERGDADADRGGEPAPQIARVDLHARKKGQHDRGEGCDEVEPLLALQVEDVAGGDPERQLDESDRNAELDRDDARDEDDGGENGGELNCIHDDLLLRFVEAISPSLGG